MLISIIINNFNYEAFVGQAIESALAQTYPNVEVIVVDDGSTDGSMNVIRRYASRIKVLAKPNGGQGSAYNAGLSHARGDVVLFLDADDWLYPEALTRVADVWQPAVSKVQFRLDTVDRDGHPLGRQVPRHLHDSEALELVRDFGAYGSPPGSGNAYSMAYLLRVMPLEEPLWRTAADTVPILLAPAYGQVVSLPSALGAYRLHRRMTDVPEPATASTESSGAALLSNNAPQGLWHEYERIESTKHFVVDALAKIGMQPHSPQMMAPWETRLAALCVRFGHDEPEARHHSAPYLMTLALRSTWRWPLTAAPFKAALSLWLLGVWLLPKPLARRLANMHKASIGAASPSC